MNEMQNAKCYLPMVDSPRVTILLFVSRVDLLVVRAIAYGRSLSADHFEAVSVATNDDALSKLQSDWATLGTDVPLVILHSADEEFLRPSLGYIRSLKPGPNHAVVVLLPELVVSHWFEGLLHNESTTKLKAALRALPWVVVATVPFVPTSRRQMR